MEQNNINNEELEEIIASLKSEISSLREGEIANLKSEMSSLKEEFKEEKKNSYPSLITIIIPVFTILILILTWFFTRDNIFSEDIKEHEGQISALDKHIEFLDRQLNESIKEVVKVDEDREVTITRKPQDIGEDLEFTQYQTNVKDINTGKSLLKVNIDVLSRNYIWDCGKFNKLTNGDLDKLISSLSNENLQNSEGIIAVGAASNEGQKSKKLQEYQEKLATNRANTLIQKLRNRVENFNPKVPVAGFVLGQHLNAGDSCNKTQNQRRVIIISMLDKSDDIRSLNDLENELKNSFVGIVDSGFPFPVNIRNYSFFNEEKAMLIDAQNLQL